MRVSDFSLYIPFAVYWALLSCRVNPTGKSDLVLLCMDTINSFGANLNMLCMAQRVNYRDVIHNQNDQVRCVLAHP